MCPGITSRQVTYRSKSISNRKSWIKLFRRKNSCKFKSKKKKSYKIHWTFFLCRLFNSIRCSISIYQTCCMFMCNGIWNNACAKFRWTDAEQHEGTLSRCHYYLQAKHRFASSWNKQSMFASESLADKQRIMLIGHFDLITLSWRLRLHHNCTPITKVHRKWNWLTNE